MATIIQTSELVRRAVTWLDQRLAEKPGAEKNMLLDEAAMRFNLGPADAEALARLFRERMRQA